MKTVSFSELEEINFAATDISVIHQTPLWNALGGLDSTHNGRKLNGYLLIESGKCLYEWEEGKAELGHGDLIYLPCGAKRAVTVTEKPLSFYRISFMLFDASDSQKFIFSKTPFVALRNAGQKLFDICEKLSASTLTEANKLQSAALLFEFLASVKKLDGQKDKKRVAPAVEYIKKHYTAPIDIDTLCELCYMSKPYFFKLFKKETGTTPLMMRNALRIERAKALLFDEECQIGEIASILGFESIYYFSRSFKDIVGMSPQQYRKRK